MKILFVDDEPKVLQGLERMLYLKSDEWDMSFVESGEAAIKKLAERGFDVIVTDMRMPGMDGAALLAEVHREHPEIVRIVLSGFAELEMSMRAVPIAHQYLIKPCEANYLQEVIERALALQKLLESKELREAAGGVNALPPAPKLLITLTDKLMDPKASAEDVARIIEQDPAMVAKILQIVNSAFISRSRETTNILQAVIRLGFLTIRNLALTAEVFTTVGPAINPRVLDIGALQQHTLRVASLAMRMHKDRRLADDAFISGILHDVGKILLAGADPKRYAAAVTLASDQRIPQHEAEREQFKISHAELGAYLLGLWGLPYQIVEAVAFHHRPTDVPLQSSFGVLAAVHIADCIDRDRPIEETYLDSLGVADKIGAWRDAAKENVRG